MSSGYDLSHRVNTQTHTDRFWFAVL